MVKFLFMLLALASSPKNDDVDMVTDWLVSVAENDVSRSMEPVAPDDRYPFKVYLDQQLAPGWTCEVLPLIWHGNQRMRWLRCQNGGRATVSVRTSCRSDRRDNRIQTLYIGERVSIELSCRSGISP